VVGGNGGITKQSANTLTLENENTYSGKTLITAGTVRLGASASVAESSEINLADNTFFHVADVTGGYELGANQTLSGTGTVVGNTAIQGTLSPGHSSGTLTVDGNAEWTAGANYNWQVLTANTNPADQSAAGTAWDFFDVTGTLNLMGLDISNRFNLNLWSLSSTGPDVNGEIAGWDPNVGNTWRIANANGGISLNGSGLLANTDYSSYFNINTAATNGTGGWVGGLPSSFQVLTLADTNSLYLSAVGSAAVPEPGQVAASILLLAGIGGYVWMKRRKTVKPAPTAV
jgi:autotransporter-associated beta strand protein